MTGGQLSLLDGDQPEDDVTTWCSHEWCHLPADVYVRASRRFWWPYCNGHATDARAGRAG